VAITPIPGRKNECPLSPEAVIRDGADVGQRRSGRISAAPLQFGTTVGKARILSQEWTCLDH